MKKIKKSVFVDLNTVIGISQYCNLNEFKNLLQLNKFINKKLKTSYIDYNIIFVFRWFPTEPLLYVNILRIKYKSIDYFSYLNNSYKFNEFFQNLKQVQITESLNMERQPDINFFWPFRPLPKYVTSILLQDVNYCEEASNIITKNIKKLTLNNISVNFDLNFKKTNIEVLKIWYTKFDNDIFGYNHWFPETLVKLKIDLRRVGISIDDQVKDIFCLPNLKKLDIFIRLNQMIDLALSKVNTLIINYDMDFSKPISYLKMTKIILNKSNYLERFEVKFNRNKNHFRQYIKLSNTIIKNKYKNRIVNLKEITLNDIEICLYIGHLKSKMNNVKTIFYLMCSENVNVFSYFFFT